MSGGRDRPRIGSRSPWPVAAKSAPALALAVPRWPFNVSGRLARILGHGAWCLVLASGACMSNEVPKLEPRLRVELERVEHASGDASLIPIVAVYAVPAEAGPPEDLRGMAQRQKPVRDLLRARLTEIGVTGTVEELSLINGLAVRLTATQIRKVAADPLVKQLLFNKDDRVIP